MPLNASLLALGLALGAIAGCSCAEAHEASVDAGADADLDAGTDAPNDAGPDAFSRCPPVDEPRTPSGNCDGLGRAECLQWAFDEIHGLPQRDGGWTPYAECVQTPWPASCARASDAVRLDAGDGPSSELDFRCGEEPACGPYEVCASRFDGDPPSCRCIADAP